jgi:hypothetical protein
MRMQSGACNHNGRHVYAPRAVITLGHIANVLLLGVLLLLLPIITSRVCPCALRSANIALAANHVLTQLASLLVAALPEPLVLPSLPMKEIAVQHSLSQARCCCRHARHVLPHHPPVGLVPRLRLMAAASAALLRLTTLLLLALRGALCRSHQATECRSASF